MSRSSLPVMWKKESWWKPGCDARKGERRYRKMMRRAAKRREQRLHKREMMRELDALHEERLIKEDERINWLFYEMIADDDDADRYDDYLRELEAEERLAKELEELNSWGDDDWYEWDYSDLYAHDAERYGRDIDSRRGSERCPHCGRFLHA